MYFISRKGYAIRHFLMIAEILVDRNLNFAQYFILLSWSACCMWVGYVSAVTKAFYAKFIT